MIQSQTFAARLVAALYLNGIQSFYLAPGSRSQALAIAAAQLRDAGLVDLTIRLDERSMGFMALGRALGEKRPVALITTSGTAVANLHPAVLEAHHSGVPLILLTADRPARLRGLGANQTTNQVGIFADALRDLIDVSIPELEEFNPEQLAKTAVEKAIGNRDGSRPGPVQLNLQFQEPLSSGEPNAKDFVTGSSNLPQRNLSVSELEVLVSKHAVVVAGSGAGLQAEEFARKAQIPLFAEPTSGARFGSQAVVDYPQKLKTELTDQVDQVFVFGKPTLSRAVMSLISKSQVWVQTSKAHGHFDVFQNALGFADVLIPQGQADSSWLQIWQDTTAEVSLRAQLASKVWNASSDNELLLFGASQIIREAEGALEPKQIKAFANRGLAGIDGTVSTALGLAQTGLRTRAILGDLTLLHDASSLNRSQLRDLNVQLIVGNDNGGEIFRRLEVANQISAEQLEELFLTPQQVNIESLAKAYGWNYLQLDSLDALDDALRADGFWLIEFKL